MEIKSPAWVRNDLARVLIRDWCVIVPAVRHCMHQRRASEGRILAIEITGKRQVDRRFAGAIEINSDTAFFRGRGPHPPNTTWAIHLGQNQLVTFFANDAIAIAIGIPVDVLIGPRIITALPIVARPLGTLLVRSRQSSKVLKVRQPINEIGVGEFAFRSREGRCGEGRAEQEQSELHGNSFPPCAMVSLSKTREPSVSSFGTGSPFKIFKAVSIASPPPV